MRRGGGPDAIQGRTRALAVGAGAGGSSPGAGTLFAPPAASSPPPAASSSSRAASNPPASTPQAASNPPPHLRLGDRVIDRTRTAFDRAVADAGARRSPRTALLEATKWFVPGDRDRRHDAVLEVLARWEVRSVLEIGSGAGDFYARMRSRLPTVSSYTGYDLSPRMVAIARRRHPRADFRHGDILGADILGCTPGREGPLSDAVVAVGVFALLVDDPAAHWLLMRRLIRRMFELARVGIVFDFYDFFTERDARRPHRYFTREIARTDDTPIYCVRPTRVRRFAAGFGPVALTRIREVDGRVWRCVVKRPDAGGLTTP